MKRFLMIQNCSSV